jgi:CRISPR-associated endoribonuclease Cas6
LAYDLRRFARDLPREADGAGRFLFDPGHSTSHGDRRRAEGYHRPMQPQPADLPALPLLPYLRLRIALRAQAPAQLPPYHGSLLRGAFGHALRRAVCAFGPAAPCAGCRLRRACAYPLLFEPLIEGEPPPLLRGLRQAPRPYVFEPGTAAFSTAPAGPAAPLPAGGLLPFDLLLFGRAAGLAPFALLAIEDMAAAGLGRGRTPFALDRAAALEPGGAWRELRGAGGGDPGDLPPPSLPSPAPLPERLRLRFLTPARLQVRGRLAAEIGFRDLAFALLRRTLEVAHFHLPGAAVDWNRVRPLLDQAAGVQVTAGDLAWRDWRRYSNRQQAEMVLGGLVGSLTLEGDLAPFGPLLRTGEVLHVGKGATFGLGRIAVEELAG